jgi:hypothetical protein
MLPHTMGNGSTNWGPALAGGNAEHLPLTTEALAEVLPELLPVAETLAVMLLLALVLPLAEAVCTEGGGGGQLTVNRMCDSRRVTVRPMEHSGDGMARTARDPHLG